MQQYDLQKMQELLHDFYNLTEMKLCFYDSNENELCYYPEKLTDFCKSLRRDKKMDERCKECDRLAFSVCKQTHKRHIYTCHAGLLECLSPILYDGHIIGYIALGQIKMTDRPDFEKLAPHFAPRQKEELKQSFNRLTSVGMEKINSAIHIFDACASYEYLKNLIKVADSDMGTRIGGFINKNIGGDLSVQALCTHFRLSRSELYSVFKKYFDSSVADYIKKHRLRKACELLKQSDLPVYKIAEQCGMPDYNYFSKVFKRTCGMSPKAYRKS